MEKTIVLQNQSGLHARPAAVFVEAASKFKAEVTVESNGKSANGKSILYLLSLGVTKGQTIKIVTNGADAAEALEHLSKLIDNRFGEA